jgi:hypothetical protein
VARKPQVTRGIEEGVRKMNQSRRKMNQRRRDLQDAKRTGVGVGHPEVKETPAYDQLVSDIDESVYKWTQEQFNLLRLTVGTLEEGRP